VYLAAIDSEKARHELELKSTLKAAEAEAAATVAAAVAKADADAKAAIEAAAAATAAEAEAKIAAAMVQANEEMSLREESFARRSQAEIEKTEELQKEQLLEARFSQVTTALRHMVIEEESSREFVDDVERLRREKEAIERELKEARANVRRAAVAIDQAKKDEQKMRRLLSQSSTSALQTCPSYKPPPVRPYHHLPRPDGEGRAKAAALAAAAPPDIGVLAKLKLDLDAWVEKRPGRKGSVISANI